MLAYLRNVQLSLLVISLTCCVPMVYAHGNFEDNATCTVAPAEECRPVHIKKQKRHHAKKSRHRCANKSKKTTNTSDYTGLSDYDLARPSNPKPPEKNHRCKNSEGVILGYCEPLPPLIVNCKTINPSDLVDLTCNEFSENIESCTPYACQAPYALDPSVKTKWQIHGKSGGRCIVSNTTDDVGMKDDDGKPLPITQMCEYDAIGIKGLIQRFSDMENRYFHFSTCEHFEGVHNCTFKTGDLRI